METKKEILRDKIHGIIFGGALGDAVGLSTEFMNKETAKILYGFGPIKFGFADGHEYYRDNHRRRWHENDFTDDTDQLLLILQCLLSTSGHLFPSHFAYRLKEWTELGFPELSNKACCGVGFTVGSVVGHPKFLTHPHKASFDVWNSHGRDLAANGAVMRTAVLGIPFFFNETQVVSNAINCAKVTHADPRSIFSSVVASVLISIILTREIQTNPKPKEILNQEMCLKLLSSGSDETLEDTYEPIPNFAELCIPKSRQEVEVAPAPISFMERIRKKLNLKSNDPADEYHPSWFPKHKENDTNRVKNPVKCEENHFSSKSIETDDEMSNLIKETIEDYKFLLEGNEKMISDVDKLCLSQDLDTLELDDRKSIGYTLKCLGSALYCFSKKFEKGNEKRFFMDMITELTLEAGDSDTNCAVAGALLGVRLGMKGLPDKWIKGLRHKEFLTNVSDQLTDLVWHQYLTQENIQL